ncbi:MAG: carboxypeptidase regulatory-like domain-containing protein [Cyanobacteria bacterium J06632_22]
MRAALNVKQYRFWISAIFGLLVSSQAALPAWAHGAISSVETLTTVRITSQYDTGEPIAQGQVAVYSPDNVETPWLTGTTDASGVFEFIPSDVAGNWEVIIRKAGHGQSITVPLGTEGGAKAPSFDTGLSTLQKVITGLAVVWGFLGTALFFARRSPPVVPSSLPSPSSNPSNQET